MSFVQPHGVWAHSDNWNWNKHNYRLLETDFHRGFFVSRRKASSASVCDSQAMRAHFAPPACTLQMSSINSSETYPTKHGKRGVGITAFQPWRKPVVSTALDADLIWSCFVLHFRDPLHRCKHGCAYGALALKAIRIGSRRAVPLSATKHRLLPVSLHLGQKAHRVLRLYMKPSASGCVTKLSYSAQQAAG